MLRQLTGLCICVGISNLALAGQFEWLEGHWVNEHSGHVSEEAWSDGDGGLYLAVNRSIRNGKAEGFEFLRIEESAQASRYCAQPAGSSAVCFELAEAGAQHAVFENPAHDFPQRVRYERQGNRLFATISDLEGGQSMSFEWTKRERR